MSQSSKSRDAMDLIPKTTKFAARSRLIIRGALRIGGLELLTQFPKVEQHGQDSNYRAYAGSIVKEPPADPVTRIRAPIGNSSPDSTTTSHIVSSINIRPRPFASA